MRSTNITESYIISIDVGGVFMAENKFLISLLIVFCASITLGAIFCKFDKTRKLSKVFIAASYITVGVFFLNIFLNLFDILRDLYLSFNTLAG